MDIRQLVTFRMLARTLSFTRTATALNYVQSTVTAQIQALEAEMDVQLFDRLGKRVALTDAGQRLLDYAERILALAEEARQAVARHDEPAGTLTISAPESLCIYRLPAILSQFRAAYPQVRLLFRPISFADMRRHVSENQLDMAFVLDEPLRSTELAVEPLIEEPVLLIAPPDHPLAVRSSVLAAHLEGEAVVLTEAGCTYRTLFERALSAAGVYPTDLLEFSSVEAIKQCVMAGMGIGVLPAFVVSRELEQGRVVALNWDSGAAKIVTQMVWHRDKWLSPALCAFLQLAREMLTQPQAREAEY